MERGDVRVEAGHEDPSVTPVRDPPRIRLGFPLLAVLSGTLAAVAIALSTSSPPPASPAPTSLPPLPESVLDSRIGAGGEWALAARLDTDATPARRLGQGYLLEGPDGGFVMLGPDLEVHPIELTGARLIAGTVTDSNQTLIFGAADVRPPAPVPMMSDLRPAIWRGSAREGFSRSLLPWHGVVRAVAVRGETTTVIGTASFSARPQLVLAESRGGDRWTVQPAPWIPDSAILSVPGGFIGRGRSEAHGPVRYLHSTDGREWEPVGDYLIKGGGTAALVDPATETLLLPGIGGMAAPVWPVGGVWAEGSRVWLHAPGEVWTTADGERWSRLPLDEEHGLPNGFVSLLPFGDRAVVAVTTSTETRLYEWRQD